MSIEISNPRKVFIALIVLAIVLLAISTLLNRTGEKKGAGKEKGKVTLGTEKTLPPLFSTPEKGLPLSFIGETPSFPEEAMAYKISAGDLSGEEATNLAKAFGFETTPTVAEDKVDGKIYFWDNGTAVLYLRLKQSVLEYTLKDLVSKTSEMPLSFDRAKAVSEEFLKSKNLFTDLYFSDVYTYLKGILGEAHPASVEDAEAIKVSLDFKVANLPIVSDYLGSEPVTIVLRNDATIISLKYFLFNRFTLEKVGSVPLKSFTQARTDLNNGKEISIGLSDEEGRTAPGGVFLTKAYLGYYFSSQTQTLQPVFIFEGMGGRVLEQAAKR